MDIDLIGKEDKYMQYEELEMEVIEFEAEDIITDSGEEIP